MKALKLKHEELTLNICKAIETCYKNDKTTQSEITGLYFTIGQNISQQGEKAFIPHLEKVLTEKYAHIKGFSMRNLRRMRDFYLNYENNAQLLNQALMLGWTQNTVILEYIKIPADREFYIGLATLNGLSKLALISAIESNISDVALQESESTIVRATVEPVCRSKDIHEELQANAPKTSVAEFSRECDTAVEIEKKSPIVRATVEPVRQSKYIHEELQANAPKTSVADFSREYDTVMKEEQQSPIVRPIAEPVLKGQTLCHEITIHNQVPATALQTGTWKMSRKCADIIENASLENLSRAFLIEALNCFYTIEPPPEKQAWILAEMRKGKEKIPI